MLQDYYSVYGRIIAVKNSPKTTGFAEVRGWRTGGNYVEATIAGGG